MSLVSTTTIPDGGTPSTAISTIGATIIVVVVGGDLRTSPVTDSQLNTWISLTYKNGAFNGGCQIHYVLNPLTSATHTFSTPGGTDLSGVVMAFDSNNFSYDQESGVANGSSGSSPGAITPSKNNSILVTGIGGNVLSTPATVSGFGVAGQVGSVGGVNWGCAGAYLEQAVAASVNPVWGWNGNASGVVMASFIPNNSRKQLAALGVG